MNDDAFADQLTALLEEEHAVTPGLEQRILANLPDRDAMQRAYDWFASSLLRPAIAAALPLLIGFGLGFASLSADVQFDNDVVALAFAESFEELNHD